MTNELYQCQYGRKRIYTDVKNITADNVCDVISKAFTTHMKNVADIKYLLRYEEGDQPLVRTKEIRPEIDIKDIQNLAHYITDFKLSYNWGNPISFVKKDDKGENSQGMRNINDMLDEEDFNTKNQELCRYFEITGIGYSYINTKKRDVGDKTKPTFDYQVINPEYAFKVYHNGINEEAVLDVMYCVLENGTRIFYAYTKDYYFEIKDMREITNGKKKDKVMGVGMGVKNTLGMLPLVEWLRDSDRMGCFEREIDALNALNVKNSDFSNDVAQKVQDIKHANDVEFPKDDNGNDIQIKSGDMIKTYTSSNGKTPFIKAVGNEFNYEGTQKKIQDDANAICTRCFVPLHVSLGGGSTGTATSMSSGWQEAEAFANKQEMIIKKSLKQVMRLILKTCEIMEYDKEIGDLDIRDIEPHILRNKTYDLNIKTNAFATLVSHGISLKDALIITDVSGDIAQVIKNSQELVDKYQNREFGEEEKTGMQDESNQIGQSPILDGMTIPKKELKPENKQNL